MLVLNRRAGDAIHLAGGIRIVVISTDRGSVKLGIEAPRTVSILREELVEAIAESNRAALASSEAPGQTGSAPTAPADGPAPRARSGR